MLEGIDIETQIKSLPFIEIKKKKHIYKRKILTITWQLIATFENISNKISIMIRL